MPILNIQMDGTATLADGQRVTVPPPHLLRMRGPLVQVSISVPAHLAAQFAKEGRQLPPPVAGLGLIDTGASVSCVDDDLAKALQLPVVNVVSLASASHASTERNCYPIAFDIIGGGARLTFNSSRTVGAELGGQGLSLLIGRDLLIKACLFYNGPMGQFTLTL